MTQRVGLIFHGIGAPTRSIDSSEERYWISVDRYRKVLDQVSKEPARYYLSFDDGNSSDFEIGLPELTVRGLKADFFVLSGRIGHSGSLDERQIRALAAAGMGVGSHGVAHLDWKSLGRPELDAEVRESKMAIEAILGQAVDKAAIPFGSYKGTTLKALREAGYSQVYSSDGGTMEDGDYPAPRTSIRADLTDSELEDVVSGRQTLSQRTRRNIAIALKKRTF